MDMTAVDMIGLVLMLMLVGLGGYAFYTWFRLRHNWGIFPNKLLLPGNCAADDCQDVDGYLEYVSLRLFILGLLCFGCAIVYVPVILPNIAVLLGMGGDFYDVYCNVVPFLGFLVLLWYMFVQNRSAKRFW